MKIHVGDIFDQQGILVIPVNREMVHGAGLAHAAKRRRIIYDPNQTYKLIVKEHWSDAADPTLVAHSLAEFGAYAGKHPDQTFWLPLVGLGHGEGEPEQICPLIRQVVLHHPNVQLIAPSPAALKNVRKGRARTDHTLQRLPEIFHHLAGGEGVVLGFGYRGRTRLQLAALRRRWSAKIVDIRLQPYSGNPDWRREELQEYFGHHYQHLPALGNRNYKRKGGPHEIADPDAGLPAVMEHTTAGCNVILLCACDNAYTCHRRTVADMLHDRLATVVAPTPDEGGES